MIAFNVKEEAAQHFKDLSADRLKMYFDALDDSINGAMERLKREPGHLDQPLLGFRRLPLR
jgi:uncharacterized protein YbjQ (UPF0145 family)